jgi:hypothetical protein
MELRMEDDANQPSFFTLLTQFYNGIRAKKDI